MLDNTRFRLGFPVLALSFFFAGDAWRFTISWTAFGVVAVLGTVVAVWLLWRQRARWSLIGLPLPLLLFLALATVSIFWSQYPSATLLGLTTTWVLVINGAAIAITFSWGEILRALGIVFRLILGLSLLFELFVSVVIGHRILPLFGSPGVDYESYKRIPGILMWSRNELFEVFDGGRIQGILGNADALGFVALLALIVFALQVASKKVSRASGTFWILLAIAMMLMTNSATVTLSAFGVAVVLLIALLVRHAKTGRGRVIVYLTSSAVLAGGLTAGFVLRNHVLALLGKSSDLTGRVNIWESVLDLAQQRPAFGWGWVSVWMPWAKPFDNLAHEGGIRQLQAHNVWVDVVFQLGLVGLIIFVALVAASLVKAWQHAVDRPQEAPGAPLRYRAITLLPLLFMVALIVQSAAESRLIHEFGIVVLVIIAIKTKRRELV